MPGPRETQETINKWQEEQFPAATYEGVLGHFYEEVKEFIFEATGADDVAFCKEAADVYILLAALCDKRGVDLHTWVDIKMTENRQRQWNIQPDGTGRHR